MLTLVLVIILTAVIAFSISIVINTFFSSKKEEQLPIENPEVVKPTLTKKTKTKNSNNLKLKK
jgi:uncharacterized protein YneF (UPF0154 family)